MTQATTAIVIGASMGGLAAARVLSEHVDRVEVIERDALPVEAATRRGVPQGRHAHILLAAGEGLLDGWFPGLADELLARGAVRCGTERMVWFQAGGYRVQADLGLTQVSMTRPLLEGTVRRRLVSLPNVTITDGVSVDRLIVERGRVSGVTVDGVDRRADLVVDCSGRQGRFLTQLESLGFPAPDVTAIRIDMAYGTRIVPRRPSDVADAFIGVVDSPARGHRIGVAVPVEDDRWIITLGGFHGDAPPSDPVEFERFARSLPASDVAELLDGNEALTPVMTHRMATSQRRHVERLRETPAGYVVLGDGICSFNPIYGQGMSSAAMQADVLGEAVGEHGPASAELARAFYRRAAKVVDVPWKIAAGTDFAHPATTGRKPFGTDLTNRYLDQVLRAYHTSVPVSRRMFEVQNLLARPESLMTPAMMARVLWAARRSPANDRTILDEELRMPATA
ncbi:MAG: FAD-dependent monooxygenase [Actinomycetota bacterium]|nr:FAD-dependent monooxygenase [Actinomycetota bacterium]